MNDDPSAPRLSPPLAGGAAALVLGALRRVAAEPTLQGAMDRCAAEAAAVAGYRGALLTLSFEGGTEVGSSGLSDGEREHFTSRKNQASPSERRANRARMKERCFPGTSITFVSGATRDWNALPSPRVDRDESSEQGWLPNDALFVLVHDASGADVGVLSLDAPADGRAPRPDTLQPVDNARVLVDFAADLLAARRAAQDRASLEEQLWQAQKVDLLGRVTCEVAHDLNNVLSVVSGLAELAGERSADPALLRLFDGIQRAGDRGSEMTRRLLSFGRHAPEQGTVLLDFTESVRSCRPLLDQILRRHHTLTFEERAAPLPVLGADIQVVQIVLNLVVNARDAMPDGGRVTLRTEPFEENGMSFVRLQVQDEGVGMSEATSARALEPFFTTKPDGTGLGLATVHGIVTRLGGRLRIESELGRGTTIRVELPRA